ncbi:hypothetical protein B5S33_g2157 [[Candida] boidinii]|nr:hypothetical protein B5S30_g2189 [[Candida] boidinii]OWB83526.1 hypothetical protein B5S33_g2157 [[Candida] boidinii]
MAKQTNAKILETSSNGNLYQDRYEGEQLITVSGEAPSVKDISGKHGIVVGATIDKLLEGASTQCLQNINLAMKNGEYAGIPDDLIIRG